MENNEINMPNVLEAFVQSSADRHEELEAMALDKLPQIQSRALELFNDAEARRDKIAFWFLNDGYERMIAAGKSEEFTAEYWDDVAELVDLSMDELMAMPFDTRDAIWDEARKIVVAVSNRQATIESGLITEALRLGKGAGEELRENTEGVSRAQLEKATFFIKDVLKERKAKK